MSKLKDTVENNKKLIASAAVFETGRIANKKLATIMADKLPTPVGMVIDTPIGRVLMANLIKLAVDQIRPDHQMAARLTNGMIAAAYVDVLQDLDVEGILDGLLGDSAIAAGLSRQED